MAPAAVPRDVSARDVCQSDRRLAGQGSDEGSEMAWAIAIARGVKRVQGAQRPLRDSIR